MHQTVANSRLTMKYLYGHIHMGKIRMNGGSGFIAFITGDPQFEHRKGKIK